MRDQLKQASIPAGTLGSYSRNFKYWESLCNTSGSQCGLTTARAQQPRLVGPFGAVCASEGHNKAKKGNKNQIFDGKMAALVFAHKAVRNAKLNYHDPELELIAQGYKRSHGDVDRKQSVTTLMLRTIRELLAKGDPESDILWVSVVLVFIFLDGSSELWDPAAVDRSTGINRTNCVKAVNVIPRHRRGTQVGPEDSEATSVEIIFESHKGDRVAHGITARHYKSNHTYLCPVEFARQCLRIRAQWQSAGQKLGPFLTSSSTNQTIKKTCITDLIKAAAAKMGLPKRDYSCHSLRIRGACALLAAGKSDLAIRLMVGGPAGPSLSTPDSGLEWFVMRQVA